MNVRLFYLNSIGPVLATVQRETTDSFFVRDPVSIYQDEHGMGITEYLGLIPDHNNEHVFYKYNIISNSCPNQGLLEAYTSALSEVDDTPKIFMPEQKLVLPK